MLGPILVLTRNYNLTFAIHVVIKQFCQNKRINYVELKILFFLIDISENVITSVIMLSILIIFVCGYTYYHSNPHS